MDINEQIRKKAEEAAFEMLRRQKVEAIRRLLKEPSIQQAASGQIHAWMDRPED